jgi:hypothetical protein
VHRVSGSSTVVATTPGEAEAVADGILRASPQVWLARTPPYLCTRRSEILPGLFVPDRSMPEWVREAIGPELVRKALGLGPEDGHG